ncbi:MAG TPA: hypothetical protein VGC90_03905 [Candidatus Limnocylindrales bacterium]|jgi:hypothetical protein
MHPWTMQQLATLKMNEALEEANRARLASAARAGRVQPIDVVPFRERVGRLFAGLPSLIDRSRPAGA